MQQVVSYSAAAITCRAPGQGHPSSAAFSLVAALVVLACLAAPTHARQEVERVGHGPLCIVGATVAASAVAVTAAAPTAGSAATSGVSAAAAAAGSAVDAAACSTGAAAIINLASGMRTLKRLAPVTAAPRPVASVLACTAAAVCLAAASRAAPQDDVA